eukprot:1151078-Pelagomonas_calceolata.AAC.1
MSLPDKQVNLAVLVEQPCRPSCGTVGCTRKWLCKCWFHAVVVTGVMCEDHYTTVGEAQAWCMPARNERPLKVHQADTSVRTQDR